MREKGLFQEERLRKIFEQLKLKKKVLVSDLSKEFGISKTTVRSDLIELESRGVLTRTHGGAILRSAELASDKTFAEDNLPLNARINTNHLEKNAIGELAATLINDGDTLMVDGGTTTSAFVDYLTDKKNLTIITNSYILIPRLSALENSVVYLAGGLVYEKHSIMVGNETLEFLSQFKPNKLILGIDGISRKSGLTVADNQMPAVVSIKKKMIELCAQTILVCDYSKIGRDCLMRVAPASNIDYLITDSNADKEELQMLHEVIPNILITPKVTEKIIN